MANEVIIEHTKLAENITSKVKPVHLKVPSLMFRLDVPAEKAIRKAYDEDPLLRAKLNEAAGKVYDSIERQMEIATRGWDAKVEKVKTDDSSKKALAKEYQKLFESQVDLAVKAAQRSTEAVWTELVRTKKDYAKYKWKAGIKVSLGAASLSPRWPSWPAAAPPSARARFPASSASCAPARSSRSSARRSTTSSRRPSSS